MTLIIGDIHGCYDELQALLDQAGIADDEAIIAIGDLVDKGPAPAAVLDFFMTHPTASSIRGNHEQQHLRSAQGHIPPPLAQLRTRWYLGERYDDALAYMQSLQLYLELDDALLVHAYVEPGRSLDQQRDDVLLGMDAGLEYLQTHYDTAWFAAYDGEKPVIVGHKDYTQMQKPFIFNDRVFGIDTRCVLGGALTGLKLPEWRLFRIESPRNYWQSVTV